MPIADDIERAIIEVADKAADRAVTESWPSDKIWSRELLSGLGRIGHSRGFYVCGTACNQFGQGEWLYDLAWLKLENGKSGNILDVPLIVESEWGKLKLIHEDFQKLLLGRAQHRVMILQERDVRRLYTGLIEQVKKFGATKPGDRYLFLGLDWTDKKFKPELFVA